MGGRVLEPEEKGWYSSNVWKKNNLKKGDMAINSPRSEKLCYMQVPGWSAGGRDEQAP